MEKAIIRDKDTMGSNTKNVHEYYTMKKIHRFERIFGISWVSTGGETTTREFCMLLNLKPGQKVLDIGCGTGGSSFHMARQYGCEVLGIDLCSTMTAFAKERLNCEEDIVRKRVTIVNGDVFETSFPENEFDVIYIRDVVMHIDDKERLFSRIQPWLKPGGRFLITEYVRGDHKISSEFEEYCKERHFYVRTFNGYQQALKSSGFQIVEARNLLDKFRKISEDELKFFKSCKEGFLKDFTQEDYNWMITNWEAKMTTTEHGDQSWALFICTK